MSSQNRWHGKTFTLRSKNISNGHQCCVDGSGSQTYQRKDCWCKDATCKTCGKQRHLANVCRSGNTQTPRQGSPKTRAPKALAKVQGKVEAREKAKERIEHLKHVHAVEKDTRSHCRSRLVHGCSRHCRGLSL